MKKRIFIILMLIICITIIGFLSYQNKYKNLSTQDIQNLSDIDLLKNNQKVIIFSPHGDDEILSSGGYIQASIKNGAQIYVVFITNGDSNFFSTAMTFHKVLLSSNDYIESGYLRQNESINALNILGIKKDNIIFLGYPDKGLSLLSKDNILTQYKSTSTNFDYSPYNNSYSLNTKYTGQNLENDIENILIQIDPDVIIIPSPDDSHKDHSASSILITNKILNINKNSISPKIFYYLIHYPNYPNLKGFYPDNFLSLPTKLSSNKWQKFELNNEVKIQKNKSLQQYQSQLKVPFLSKLMKGFIKNNELFYQSN